MRLRMSRAMLLLGTVIVWAIVCGSIHAATVYKGTTSISGVEELETSCSGTPIVCQQVWPYGVLTITANGKSVSTIFQQGSTAATLATSLCSQMTSAFPVQCTGKTATSSTSETLSLQATTDYTVSTSCSQYTPGPGPCADWTAGMIEQFAPLYYILSVLYAAPGNSSNNGFSNTASNGETTSISKTFTAGQSFTFSSAVSLGDGAGVSFGVSHSSSSGSSQAFQVTYQAGTGKTIQSVNQDIDHTQDQIFLWLNPQVTLTSSSASPSNSANYTVSPQGSEQGDIININVGDLLNPVSIPLLILEPQVVKPGVTLPGLSAICAHPVPCTAMNACGCVPADFAEIVAADPLVGKSDTTPPSQVSADRFKYITNEPLEGPEEVGGAPVKTTYTVTDSALTSATLTDTDSYGVSYTSSGVVDIPGLFNFQLSNTDTFTWTNSMSYGESSGTAHTATVTFGSNKPDCLVYVDIYEDTVYHTFAFSLAEPLPSACQ
jgi:hypothetical protein